VYGELLNVSGWLKRERAFIKFQEKGVLCCAAKHCC
jgi:hypothetical protein